MPAMRPPLAGHRSVRKKRKKALDSAVALAHTSHMKNTNTTAAAKVPVVCNECGRTWQVSANAATLECAKCGGADVDVR